MKRGLCLFLGLLLMASLFVLPAGAAAKQDTVRILLSLLDVRRMEIGIYGTYLCNDAFSFQRGEKLIITLRGNGIVLSSGGMNYLAGSTLKLVRHGAADGLENGLRLDGSLNLIEGDLYITVKDSILRAVTHLSVEDYLKGVVPYEMANSFPIEALKAQAVAARTYTLRGLRSDRDYDMTDTPNDQVYRGYNDEHTQALRAIQETVGLCLSYQGQLAQSFYTASNGGQTESALHAWQRESIPYLTVKDDPYDVENSESIRRTYRLPRFIPDESSLNPGLLSMIKAAVGQQIAKQGYDGDPASIRIRGIQGLEAHAPRYAEPSRLLTRLRLSVSLSARRLQMPDTEANLFATAEPQVQSTQQPAAQWGSMMPLEQPVTIDLPLFPELERALALSINLKENEVVSVRETQDAFELTFARYGHGVGLSQRGAEWMAKQYGKTYQEILGFYYPGTQLTRHQTTRAERPSLDALFLSTPGPRPTATPRPTLVPLAATTAPGQWMVTVSGIAANSSLNLRQQPTLDSPVIYQLFYGQRLLVLERAGEGWLRVSVGDLQGYVMASFVTAD